MRELREVLLELLRRVAIHWGYSSSSSSSSSSQYSLLNARRVKRIRARANSRLGSFYERFVSNFSLH